MDSKELDNAFKIMDAVMTINVKIDILSSALAILKENPTVKKIFLETLNNMEN